jgi:hypothetical protein
MWERQGRVRYIKAPCSRDQQTGWDICISRDCGRDRAENTIAGLQPQAAPAVVSQRTQAPCPRDQQTGRDSLYIAGTVEETGQSTQQYPVLQQLKEQCLNELKHLVLETSRQVGIDCILQGLWEIRCKVHYSSTLYSSSFRSSASTNSSTLS